MVASSARVLGACVALVVVGSALVGAASAEEARFSEMTATWGQAFNDGDVEGVAALYTEDARFISTTGRVFEGPAAIAAYLQAIRDAGLVEIRSEPLEFASDGSIGFTSGRYTFVTPTGVEIPGHYLIVYRMVDGEWRIHRHQSSPIEPQP